MQVVLIKPGPTDTPMTADLKAQGQARSPPVEDVARATVNGIDAADRWSTRRRSGRPIMLVVRHMPRFVFNRLSI